MMKLSIIIPVYNERDTIEEILNRVESVKGHFKKEVIVVDDGSTDGTREILKSNGHHTDKIIYQSENRGKGYVIRAAIEQMTGDVAVIQDADLEYDPNDFVNLFEPIRRGEADVVYGSRLLNENYRYSHVTFALGGKLLSFLTNLLYRTSITDEPTCYKMFRSSLLKRIKLECKGFEFCPEVTAKIARQGVKIVEVPIHYYPRKKNEGKKINWVDGLTAIWTLIRIRFSRKKGFILEREEDLSRQSAFEQERPIRKAS